MAVVTGKNPPFGSHEALVEWNKQHAGLVQEGLNDFSYSFIDALERLNAQMTDIFRKDVVYAISPLTANRFCNANRPTACWTCSSRLERRRILHDAL